VSRFENLLLQLSTWFAALSGTVFLIMKNFMKNDDPFSVLGHPWQPHMLAIHVLVGPVMVFALGLIAREHVLGRYLDGAGHGGRRSGASTILLAAPMIVSGYLLQVVTDPTPRKILVILHLAAGFLFTLVFLVHLLRVAGRKRAARIGLKGGQAAP
jgi:hypothetical protein